MTTFARPLVIALVCMAFTGCSAVGHGPVTALVTVDMKGPVSAGPAAGSSKVGRAEAWGILVYATGDASISAAMKNGGITRGHPVHHQTGNFLRLLPQETTHRYREENRPPVPPHPVVVRRPAHQPPNRLVEGLR